LAVALQRLRVARDGAAVGRGRGRIVGILAGDHLENGDCIGNGARHRSRDVGEQAQRHDAGAAGQPHRRTNTHERLMRRRTTDGIAGVGAESHLSEIGRYRGGRSAARTRGHAVERVWIP